MSIVRPGGAVLGSMLRVRDQAAGYGVVKVANGGQSASHQDAPTLASRMAITWDSLLVSTNTVLWRQQCEWLIYLFVRVKLRADPQAWSTASLTRHT